MSFTNTEAAEYSLFIMHAMDFYRIDKHNLRPKLPDQLTKNGWAIRGWLKGKDVLFERGPLGGLGRDVCYGFLIENDKHEFVLAIRGTDGYIEWIEDGHILPDEFPYGGDGAHVERGFWEVYKTLEFIGADGAQVPILDGVSKALGQAGQIKILGHSLGAALATYLTMDLARLGFDDKMQTCLFASPHPGNAAFVDAFEKQVSDYSLFNYVLDIVPHVPVRIGYKHLPRLTVMTPFDVQASLRPDFGSQHHIICYCAMLDYTVAEPYLKNPPVGEEKCARSVIGPRLEHHWHPSFGLKHSAFGGD